MGQIVDTPKRLTEGEPAPPRPLKNCTVRPILNRQLQESGSRTNKTVRQYDF